MCLFFFEFISCLFIIYLTNSHKTSARRSSPSTIRFSGILEKLILKVFSFPPLGKNDPPGTNATFFSYNRQLCTLISVGKAKPSLIISHELPLDEAPEAYKHFDARDNGWTKVILHPNSALKSPKK